MPSSLPWNLLYSPSLSIWSLLASCGMSIISFSLLCVLLSEIYQLFNYFHLLLLSFLLNLFCFYLYVSIFRLIWKLSLSLFIWYVCFMFTFMSSSVSCPERKLWFSLFFRFEDKLWLILLMLLVTVRLGSTTGSSLLSTLYYSCAATCFLLFVQLSGFPPSLWTALSHWQFHCLLSALLLGANFLPIVLLFSVSTPRVYISHMSKNVGPLPGTTKKLT